MHEHRGIVTKVTPGWLLTHDSFHDFMQPDLYMWFVGLILIKYHDFQMYITQMGIYMNLYYRCSSYPEDRKVRNYT